MTKELRGDARVFPVLYLRIGIIKQEKKITPVQSRDVSARESALIP